MPSLNLRDVTSELIAELKADAKANGITLREHCLKQLARKERVMVKLDNLPLPTTPKAIAAAIPGVSVGVPASKPADDCPHCGRKTVEWGPEHHRCLHCNRNYPRLTCSMMNLTTKHDR